MTLTRLKVADYAAWQREHLAGAAMDTHIEYWQKELTGAPPLLELPTDRPRPDAFSFSGAEHRFSMPEATCVGLQRLAVDHRTTPFVVALTALQVRTCLAVVLVDWSRLMFCFEQA